MSSTGVSVVTTTWNERENIKNLILNVRVVLKEMPHEVIVIDDDSSDGTIQVAKRYADVAVTKKREGQTKGLLYGMRLAKYPIIITIDADMENDPKYIPEMVKETSRFHIIMASRNKLPRISEKIASRTLGKIVGVSDVFSNYRAVRKEVISNFKLKGDETFGAEFQIIAKKEGFRIGELKYTAPPRRKNPRIGGTTRANLRITWALIKSLKLYLTYSFSFLRTITVQHSAIPVKSANAEECIDEILCVAFKK
jgi:dolichol-phosphate mannosyltransferase